MLPYAKNAHATGPHGEVRGEVPSAGVGGRPVARGRTRGIAIAVGDWRTIPAQTLGQTAELGAARRRTANPGPPPSAKYTFRAEPGGEPRVKLSAAGVAGRPVARGRADEMSELSLSRVRRCCFPNCDLAPEPPASAPVSSLGKRSDPTWRGRVKNNVIKIV
jgi:hypothetical protein